MSIDEAADALYGAPLDEFTAERTRLAKELREAGAREDAAAVAKLRKPTLAAWMLNQLARRERRDVDLLLDAGHRLREAQAGVLRGAEREAFEHARRTESDAVRRLRREAEALLPGGTSAAVLAQVEQSLRAAAVSPEGRELLARGRFVRPIEAAGGFDGVAALAAGAPPATRRRTGARAEERRRGKDAVREARARLRAAEQAAREAARTVDRIRGELDRAESAAEDAEAEVEAARRALDDAERGLSES